MSDPTSAVLTAAAKFVGEKALAYLAMKVYEGSPCANTEHLTPAWTTSSTNNT